MISFLLTFKRMLTGIVRAFHDKEFQILSLLTSLTLLSGTLFYSSVEGWSVLDSLYFCVVTLTTVGDGALNPVTTFGKIFTMIYIIAGVGLMLGFVHAVAVHIRSSRNGE